MPAAVVPENQGFTLNPKPCPTEETGRPCLKPTQHFAQPFIHIWWTKGSWMPTQESFALSKGRKPCGSWFIQSSRAGMEAIPAGIGTPGLKSFGVGKFDYVSGQKSCPPAFF